MPHSKNWGYTNKPVGGEQREANLTSEVKQAHNSFLTGALISLEPGAPVGNRARRTGKTSPYELAASDHSYFHQTLQPPWEKADITPKDKMILVYIYMCGNWSQFICISIKDYCETNFQPPQIQPGSIHTEDQNSANVAS